MFYPKIRTLYTRDDKFKVTKEYTLPVFGNIEKWLLTEKVDGTNMSVRVSEAPWDFRSTGIQVRGRTANAELKMFQGAIDSVNIGSEVLEHDGWETDTLHGAMRLVMRQHDLTQLEIFGEAYGQGIQSGGWYAPAQQFIVYDIRVNGKLWLSWQQVCDTAQALNLRTVPVVFPSATISTAEQIVRMGFKSMLTEDTRCCEGVVARPATGELTMNNGERVVWKLKHSDY